MPVDGPRHKVRPYVAWGRNQFRIGFRYVLNGVERYRWIGVTWQ